MPGCREELPTFISPMLASPGALARPGDSDAWVAECKWDGVRALVAVDALGRVSVRSRWGRDHTARFPELAGPMSPSVSLLAGRLS